MIELDSPALSFEEMSREGSYRRYEENLSLTIDSIFLNANVGMSVSVDTECDAFGIPMYQTTSLQDIDVDIEEAFDEEGEALSLSKTKKNKLEKEIRDYFKENYKDFI